MTSIMSRSVRHGFRGVPLVLVVTGLCGCFAGVKSGDKLIQMQWPEPPQQTRIKFIGTLTGERELKNGLNWKEDLMTFLSGSPLPKVELGGPMGIAISADEQRVYVTDTSESGVVVFDLAKRQVTTWKGEDTKLVAPLGIALDAQENVYVVDSSANAVRVFDRSGAAIRTLSHPSVERITEIAVDRKRGRVYVSDTSHQKSENHKVKVFDVSGAFLKDLGKGKGIGTGYLLFPTYLAVGEDGLVYVADSMNARVQVFDPDSGDVVRTFGQRGTAYGDFERPKGVALDTFGNLYVVDTAWSNVQIFNSRGQVLLYFGGRGRYPGLLNNPTGIAIDKSNRIYVADTQNVRLDVYQLVNTTADDSFIAPQNAPQQGTAGARAGANGEIVAQSAPRAE